MTGRAAGEHAAALYTGGVYASPPALLDAALEPLRAIATRTAVRALGDVPAGASVCDVGAGDGRLVRALRERGYHAVGIDPFAESPGARVSLAEAAFEESTFDGIVFWHVLEHLGEPDEALAEAVRVLKPGGRVVLSVPNLDSVQARIGGDFWFHQDVPRHRVHFTRAGVRALARRAGLALERLDTLCLDQDLLGMAQTLVSRLTGSREAGFRALKRGRLVPALALVPAGAVGAVVEGGAILAGRGGALVARGRAP